MAISFKNDYGQLAHPRILDALCRYGQETNIPYGLDVHSQHAASLIKDAFGVHSGEVYFLAGGTQTNVVFLSYALKPYEGVIACASGHINVHETAAVEGSGHKIIVVPGHDGKVYPRDIQAVMESHLDEHMVKPRVVYISDSTEIGTIYSKEELLALKKACDAYGLYLFLDGARLGSALTCKDNDLDPKDLGSLVDAFYVGGTKNGLLLGEALVIVNDRLTKDFRHHIKNKGAMLAKGYLIGIEFEEAFKDGLYFQLAKETNKTADLLKEGLKRLGLDAPYSPTNQVFVTLPRDTALSLIEEFGCELWANDGDKTTIRFVTSFMTDEEEVDLALTKIQELLKLDPVIRTV